jgi:RimJ/RimL family protein N-acetyltransferase
VNAPAAAPAVVAQRTWPRLETPRLVLRPPTAADFDAWAAFSADPEATRYLGGPEPRSTAWRGMAQMAGSWVLNGFGMFSVLEKPTLRWVGRIGPWRPDGWPGTEVGWGLIGEVHGRGYGAEAATAAIDWAFETLGWTEVIHCIDPANVPSERLAQRLGSTLRGPAKLPPPVDQFPTRVWGQTREQWYGRRSR